MNPSDGTFPPLAKRDPILEEYARMASRYDRRWAFYLRATHLETIRRLALRPRDRILDVGCGTGAFLQVISQAFPTVKLAGIDPTREMLQVARDRLQDAEIKKGWAEQIDFEDDSFDVVVSSSVFHYLRDPTKALQEKARVLKPGGRVVITDWCDDFLACRLCALCLRLFGRAHGHIYRKDECREILESAGFVEVGIESYRINWLWGVMTADGRNPDLRADSTEADRD